MSKWKTSVIFPQRYEVSDKGEVKNKQTGKLLSPNKDKDGYYYYVLCVNGHRKTIKAHRLVALTFIENPDNKPAVDHINAIKTDNRKENLRWVTNKENTNNPKTLSKIISKAMEHLPKLQEKAKEMNYGRKRVIVIGENGYEYIYPSLKVAANMLGENYTNLSERINGKRPQRKEYYVKWAN